MTTWNSMVVPVGARIMDSFVLATFLEVAVGGEVTTRFTLTFSLSFGRSRVTGSNWPNLHGFLIGVTVAMRNLHHEAVRVEGQKSVFTMLASRG